MLNYNSTIAAAAAVVGLFMGGIAATEATAQSNSPNVPEIDWETSLKKFQFDHDKFLGQRFTAKCQPVAASHKVAGLQGTDAYPSTNPLCGAALHSGKIDKEGGIVTVQLNPGLDGYKGSSQNGVDTSDLPGTQRSFVFIDATPAPEADEIHVANAPRIDWNKKFTATGLANKNLLGQRFTFNCHSAPANMKPRRVVGTDLYPFSSMVCRAAVHAGKMSMNGGLVTVQLEPGQKKLVGSIRNGIESKDGSGGHTTISFVDPPVLN